MAIWGSPPQGFGSSAVSSGNGITNKTGINQTVVIGFNSSLCDYGPFTAGTTTDGFAEAIAYAITLLNGGSYLTGISGVTIVVMPGNYSGDVWGNYIVDISSTNSGITIMGLGFPGRNQYANQITYLCETSSSQTKPMLMWQYSGSAAFFNMSNINIITTGTRGGMLFQNCLLGLVNVGITAGTPFGVASIGGGYTYTDNLYVQMVASTSTGSAAYTPTWGVINGFTVVEASLSIIGKDSMGTFNGVTTVLRPEGRLRSCFLSGTGATGSIGFYQSDCNWVTGDMAIINQNTAIYGYEPHADNYCWSRIFTTHLENIGGTTFMFNMTAVGEGGSNTPQAYYVYAGPSVNGSAPTIYNTGTPDAVIVSG